MNWIICHIFAFYSDKNLLVLFNIFKSNSIPIILNNRIIFIICLNPRIFIETLWYNSPRYLHNMCSYLFHIAVQISIHVIFTLIYLNPIFSNMILFQIDIFTIIYVLESIELSLGTFAFNYYHKYKLFYDCWWSKLRCWDVKLIYCYSINYMFSKLRPYNIFII